MNLALVDPYNVYRFLAAIAAVVVFLFSCSASQSVHGQQPAEKNDPTIFTSEERTEAVRFLGDSKAEFANALSGLTDEQLNYRADETKWSIAQVAEHLILTENTINALIFERIASSPEVTSKELFRLKDGAIPLAITNRSQKFTAPPQIQPKGEWKTRSELVAEFGKRRERTIESVKTTKVNLRIHFGENPLFGQIDGYQWIIFLDAHTRRHLAQIEEIKSDPGYPGN